MLPPWWSAVVSPAGDRLYLSNVADEFVACALDGGRARRLEWALPETVTAQDLSPDGSTLALGDPAGAVPLIDTAVGSFHTVLPRPADEAQDRVRSLAFAPDGRTLAVGTREQVRLSGYRGGVDALAFDAAGRRLATGGEDRLVEVWDLDHIRRELVRLGLGW